MSWLKKLFGGPGKGDSGDQPEFRNEAPAETPQPTDAGGGAHDAERWAELISLLSYRPDAPSRFVEAPAGGAAGNEKRPVDTLFEFLFEDSGPDAYKDVGYIDWRIMFDDIHDALMLLLEDRDPIVRLERLQPEPDSWDEYDDNDPLALPHRLSVSASRLPRDWAIVCLMVNADGYGLGLCRAESCARVESLAAELDVDLKTYPSLPLEMTEDELWAEWEERNAQWITVPTNESARD